MKNKFIGLKDKFAKLKEIDFRQKKTQIIVFSTILVIGVVSLIITNAATKSISLDISTAKVFNENGNAYVSNGIINFESTPPPLNTNEHLQSILNTTFRNKNHDNSPFINTPSASLPTDDSSPLLGPRTDYLNNPGNNPENHFSNADDQDGGGEFRTSCEFSHFAYDDPLVYPNQPRKSHLHMFFGNTHVNAYSTYDSLINSGSSTCNGQELNRTGYWVPATFDAEGYVRIPERVVLYYKGYGLAKKGCCSNGENSAGAEAYPERMALVVNKFAAEVSGEGYNLGCSSNVVSDVMTGGSNRSISPICKGDGLWNEPLHKTFAHILKFPNCWNGQDPSNWNNFNFGAGSWFYSGCVYNPPFTRVFPNLEYKVHYPLNGPETTAGWFLSSDVDKTTFTKNPGGSTIHADWWGGWNKKINQEWLENCVRKDATATDDGPDCGMGYLSDGGNNRNTNPLPGRALKFRPQFTGGYRVHASEIYNQLCKPYTNRPYTKPEDAAWCTP